jgi:glycosyltransferase involved in cell wall biosynthesis
LEFLRHALVRRAAANIAVTEHVNRRLAIPRVRVVQHGIEPERNADTLTVVSSGDKKICFAFVGRFVPEKGILIFVEALRILREQGLEFEAKLIGDGPERGRIESKIAAQDLNFCVKITGYLSGIALADELANVSVIVMPSLWEETAGLAAMEQMMRGRLVACSDIGGLIEIVGDTGLKFPPGDAGAMAEELRKTIENPLVVEEMGAMARQRARELFQRSRMIEEHTAIYQEMAER